MGMAVPGDPLPIMWHSCKAGQQLCTTSKQHTVKSILFRHCIKLLPFVFLASSLTQP